MDLQEYFKRRIVTINEALDNLLPAENVPPSQVHSAMRYSIFAGGKRVRPILFMAACEALGEDWHPLMPFACALEMIHTYSLIHDDLPCMDDDDLRRGHPTCHKIYTESTALLAGDALLTQAFTILTELKAQPDRVVKAIGLLGASAGSLGMVGGQVIDLECENKKITPELMKTIHSKKTGALFNVSIVGAAILTGTDNIKLQALQIYAENIGVAFQIVDDILDVVGDEKLIGKPVGSDERNQKATYPVLFGLENSRKMAKEAIDNALKAIGIFSEKAEALQSIAQFILNRDH